MMFSFFIIWRALCGSGVRFCQASKTFRLCLSMLRCLCVCKEAASVFFDVHYVSGF